MRREKKWRLNICKNLCQITNDKCYHGKNMVKGNSVRKLIGLQPSVPGDGKGTMTVHIISKIVWSEPKIEIFRSIFKCILIFQTKKDIADKQFTSMFGGYCMERKRVHILYYLQGPPEQLKQMELNLNHGWRWQI